MGLPVVQTSAQTSSNTNASSVVITKPTGLAVGDLMVAFVGFMHTGSSGQSVSTPSGWTSLQQVNENRVVFAAYYKVADSADVAASNFTFSFSTTVDQSGGSILRIDNFVSSNIIGTSEVDSETSPADAVISHTAASTPLSANTLYLLGFGYGNRSTGAAFTASSYTITPSVTLTEAVDTSVQEGGGAGLAFGIAVAYGSIERTSQITEYGVTLSQTPNRAEVSILILINGSYSVSTDVSHLAITPTIEGITASSVNVATDVSHLAVIPTIAGVTTIATAPTQWTNQTKPAVSTVNNLNKP